MIYLIKIKRLRINYRFEYHSRRLPICVFNPMLYALYLCFTLFHDSIMNESKNLLPGALHSKQNVFILDSNAYVHARHNPSSRFIRQYSCLLALYVNSIITHIFLIRILNAQHITSENNINMLTIIQTIL